MMNKGTGFRHTDKVGCAGTCAVDSPDKEMPVEKPKCNAEEKNCPPEKTHDHDGELPKPEDTPEEHPEHG